MIENMIELGRRAVACKRWRWMMGMAPVKRGWFSRVCVDDRGEMYVPSGPAAWRSECVPDLSDPATLGCLQALVREAYGDPSLYVRLSETTRASDGIRAWEVLGWLDASRSPDGRAGSWRGWGYASEAEALVAALEAAP